MAAPTSLAGEIRVGVRRAGHLLLFLVLCLLASAAGVASGAWQLDLLNQVAQGAAISEERAVLNDTLYGAVGLVQTGLFLVTAVLWLRWLYASYRSLGTAYREVETPGVATTRFTPGWAVGYWFIPIVNLYRPYQVMAELWSGSRELVPGRAPSRRPHLVGLWWAVYLLSGFVGRLFLRESLSAEELSGLLASTRAGLVNDVVGILAALLAILVIRDIRGWQKRWLGHQPIEPGGA